MTMADGNVMDVDSTIELRRDRSEIATARTFVRAELTDETAVVVADAALIISELVTNAIEHGSGEPIVVGVGRSDGAVVLRVASVGPGPDIGPPTQWKSASPAAGSGRGLGIVASIAADVDVELAGGRVVTTVMLER